MNKTDPVDSVLRAARAALPCLLVVFAVLVGCGPGGGGTGTGPITVTGSSTFTAGIDGTTSAELLPGCPECTAVSLLLAEGKVELVTSCHRFTYLGAWVADGRGKVILEGLLEYRASGRIETATLSVTFLGSPAATTQTQVEVATPAGQPVLGPVILERGEGTLAGSQPVCVPG